MPNTVLPITKPSTEDQNIELAEFLAGAYKKKRVTAIVRNKKTSGEEQWIVVYD